MPNKPLNIINNSLTIRDAVKKMDEYKISSLVVLNDQNKVLGIFTLGDFRRSIFFGLDIDEKVNTVINKNFKYLMKGFSMKDAKRIFIENNLINEIPVVDKKFKLLNTINKKDFISQKQINSKIFNFNKVPVIIMAGGKGTRLDPFTRILPKPLIPIGNNPIIKLIMDNFKNFGSKKFYISVNEKSSMIKAYFSDFRSKYNIKYIHEKKPLGTAGSLKLLQNNLKSSFFVINSDILIQSHLPSMLEHHKKNNNDLTIISSMRNYTIPYGVCNFDKNGELKKIIEKPNYDHFINTGLYILEPKVLKLIPRNKKFDMNELLNKMKEKKLKVGVFPISENSWLDIGQWSEYKKNLKKFNF